MGPRVVANFETFIITYILVVVAASEALTAVWLIS